MPHRARHFIVVAALSALLPASVESQIQTVPPISEGSLQKVLPQVDGWTSGTIRADRIVLSPEATYTFASVALTKADVRVRVQVSDTGKSPDGLTALAMIVVSMPPDFNGDVGGSSIKRLQVKGSPAAEVWDPERGSGEITVVVGGRFVVLVDSPKVDGLDTLRAVLDAVDLKALEGMK